MYPYKFEYYRFQLVPKKVVQLSIDNVAYTYDEIKAKKNEYRKNSKKNFHKKPLIIKLR